MTDSTYLVVGLGNPGPTYEATRHNVGFWAVADLVDRYGSSFSLNSRQRAEVATALVPGTSIRLVLARPTTFMNDSGSAVRSLATFHKVKPSHIVVIHDELDLDAGRLRVKLGGGDNGHNGLKSIRAHLGTGDFHRVRVGVGRPPGRQDAAAWVLAKMKPAELEEMRVDAAVAADAVELLVREGLVATQNRYNS
ncbi:aminoacyl-tRNA hydrolase [Tessaracoccus lapidicaptus]|uniref:Peptidyl-tRNA hydrolase n=1 Tax=Tessaracoccus lapidicaptus TaxID=1427523 RepID=A0A1C0APZ5_9ACTN|nr:MULTISPECIES: aminoacyl-tRNA hydrolase [Tessaracoccus]AQX15317.1 aminoacyl-tRNA hydrolase [Tessaracoccus sp. T2.5-30]OCL36362.1 aminoacyl-tRNA hydrolase [Tessaracoccus lapidicaptus]VEP39593.1 Peptidyl-tRNA hydrolase [Tessaracoccus lapidicaptus]